MLCNRYDTVLELDDGDLIKLDDARGTTVRVPAGTLWVTQQDDRRDVVLRAGDVWTVEREGLTLGQAQGTTRVCVAGDAVKTSAVERRRGRFVQWLIDLFSNRDAWWRRRVPYY